MKYLILVSHGGFAQGLKTSLEMFAEDKMDQVIALGLKNGSSVDDFAKECHQAVDHLTEEDTVIVLADIVGGSPLTTALTVLEEKGKLDTTVVLGGMNLPMALTSVVMKDALEGDDFVSAVLPEASAALQELKVSAATDNDDEDDDI